MDFELKKRKKKSNLSRDFFSPFWVVKAVKYTHLWPSTKAIIVHPLHYKGWIKLLVPKETKQFFLLACLLGDEHEGNVMWVDNIV